MGERQEPQREQEDRGEAGAEENGTRIGPYLTERLLGEGGMGRVFLARRADGPRDAPVALKVVRAELARDPEFLARFRREVTAARSVSSAYVVPFVDAGTDTDTAVPWLAAAFVPGPSLEAAVRTGGPLSGDALRALAGSLAGALADIHAAGLVHRDLKPSNVLLHPQAGAQVIDLGIARAMDGTRLTATGLVLGTPGFMAPEQYQGAEPQPPSDVFALGSVLAYAATGRPPFGDGPHHRVGYRTLTEEPDLDGVPEPLRTLVASCLAKDPGARPGPQDILVALGGPPTPPEPATPRTRPQPVLSRRGVLTARGVLALAAVTGIVAAGFGLSGAFGGDRPGSGARARTKASSPAPSTVAPLPAPVSGLGPPAPAGPWTRTWQDTIINRGDENNAEYERATKNGNDYAMQAWLTDGVLVRVTERAVEGLSADTGALRWTLPPPEPDMVPCKASRTAPGGVAAVTFARQGANGRADPPCDRIVAVDLATGRSRWEAAHPAGKSAIESPADIGIAGGRVIVHNKDYVAALRLTDGSLAWSHEGRAQGCAIHDAEIGQSTVAETLTCPFSETDRRTRPTTVRSVNAADGTVRWSTAIPGDIPAETVENAEPVMVSLPGSIGAEGGPMMVFDDQGRPGPQLRESQPFGRLGSWTRNHFPLTPAIFGWGGTVYTLSGRDSDRQIRETQIVAIDSRTGSIRWHVPVPAGSSPVIAGVDDRGVHVVHVTEPGTSTLVRYGLADGRAEQAGTLPVLPDRAEFHAARLYGDRLALMTGPHNLLTKGVMMFRAAGGSR